jgi:hypothetical protein
MARRSRPGLAGTSMGLDSVLARDLYPNAGSGVAVDHLVGVAGRDCRLACRLLQPPRTPVDRGRRRLPLGTQTDIACPGPTGSEAKRLDRRGLACGQTGLLRVGAPLSEGQSAGSHRAAILRFRPVFGGSSRVVHVARAKCPGRLDSWPPGTVCQRRLGDCVGLGVLLLILPGVDACPQGCFEVR